MFGYHIFLIHSVKYFHVNSLLNQCLAFKLFINLIHSGVLYLITEYLIQPCIWCKIVSTVKFNKHNKQNLGNLASNGFKHEFGLNFGVMSVCVCCEGVHLISVRFIPCVQVAPHPPRAWPPEPSWSGVHQHGSGTSCSLRTFPTPPGKEKHDNNQHITQNHNLT